LSVILAYFHSISRFYIKLLPSINLPIFKHVINHRWCTYCLLVSCLRSHYLISELLLDYFRSLTPGSIVYLTCKIYPEFDRWEYASWLPARLLGRICNSENWDGLRSL